MHVQPLCGTPACAHLPEPRDGLHSAIGWTFPSGPAARLLRCFLLALSPARHNLVVARCWLQRPAASVQECSHSSLPFGVPRRCVDQTLSEHVERKAEFRVHLAGVPQIPLGKTREAQQGRDRRAFPWRHGSVARRLEKNSTTPPTPIGPIPAPDECAVASRATLTPTPRIGSNGRLPCTARKLSCWLDKARVRALKGPQRRGGLAAVLQGPVAGVRPLAGIGEHAKWPRRCGPARRGRRTDASRRRHGRRCIRRRLPPWGYFASRMMLLRRGAPAVRYSAS